MYPIADPNLFEKYPSDGLVPGTTTGEELDDRRRARMLDESLEVLAAAWSGEPVHHRGEHYTGRHAVPAAPRATSGSARVGRGFLRSREAPATGPPAPGPLPVNLEHSDQFTELATRVTALRREAGVDAAQPYDIVAALPPGRDPAPYAAVGATWWLVELPLTPHRSTRCVA